MCVWVNENWNSVYLAAVDLRVLEDSTLNGNKICEILMWIIFNKSSPSFGFSH